MNTNAAAGGSSSFFRSAANWQLTFLLVMVATGFLSIAVSQIALGVALAALLYRWLRRRETPPATGLEKTAALLALWALIMIPFSSKIDLSIIYYRRFYLFTVIWVAASAATTERRRRQMLIFLLGGALAASLYGQVRQVQLTGGLLTQQLGVIFNAMTGGALLMMAVLVGAGFLIAPGIPRRSRIVIAAAMLPMVLGVVATMTRSAELGMVAGLGLMLLLVRPRVFGVFLVVFTVAAIVVAIYGEHLLPKPVWARIDPRYIVAGESTVQRLEMWRGGLAMIREHPVTGVGDRGLAEIAPQYYTSSDGKYFGHMHSNIIHMAVIWGLPGLILGQSFLFAGLWCLLARWRWLRRHPDVSREAPIATAWTLGGVGVWLGFYLAGLTEWYFGDAESMLIYLAILGCGLAPLSSLREPPTAG